jgi:hypothetical protein
VRKNVKDAIRTKKEVHGAPVPLSTTPETRKEGSSGAALSHATVATAAQPCVLLLSRSVNRTTPTKNKPCTTVRDVEERQFVAGKERERRKATRRAGLHHVPCFLFSPSGCHRAATDTTRVREKRALSPQSSREQPDMYKRVTKHRQKETMTNMLWFNSFFSNVGNITQHTER